VWPANRAVHPWWPRRAFWWVVRSIRIIFLSLSCVPPRMLSFNSAEAMVSAEQVVGPRPGSNRPFVCDSDRWYCTSSESAFKKCTQLLLLGRRVTGRRRHAYARHANALLPPLSASSPRRRPNDSSGRANQVLSISTGCTHGQRRRAPVWKCTRKIKMRAIRKAYSRTHTSL
jgi:hypothetical protein